MYDDNHIIAIIVIITITGSTIILAMIMVVAPVENHGHRRAGGVEGTSRRLGLGNCYCYYTRQK